MFSTPSCSLSGMFKFLEICVLGVLGLYIFSFFFSYFIYGHLRSLSKEFNSIESWSWFKSSAAQPVSWPWRRSRGFPLQCKVNTTAYLFEKVKTLHCVGSVVLLGRMEAVQLQSPDTQTWENRPLKNSQYHDRFLARCSGFQSQCEILLYCVWLFELGVSGGHDCNMYRLLLLLSFCPDCNHKT